MKSLALFSLAGLSLAAVFQSSLPAPLAGSLEKLDKAMGGAAVTDKTKAAAFIGSRRFDQLDTRNTFQQVSHFVDLRSYAFAARSQS